MISLKLLKTYLLLLQTTKFLCMCMYKHTDSMNVGRMKGRKEERKSLSFELEFELVWKSPIVRTSALAHFEFILILLIICKVIMQ